jgi:hypothetical protein
LLDLLLLVQRVAGEYKRHGNECHRQGVDQASATGIGLGSSRSASPLDLLVLTLCRGSASQSK